MALTELKGVAEKMLPHTMILNKTHLRSILKNRDYGTTAGDAGAINIYRDDAGQIRAQYMVFMTEKEDVVLNSVKDAIKWYEDKMQLIH